LSCGIRTAAVTVRHLRASLRRALSRDRRLAKEDGLIMKKAYAGVVAAGCLLVISCPALADIAGVVSSRDGTLYQDPEGDVANGAGSGMFAGRNAGASNNIRRGLVWFDIAGAIPAGSMINGVTLALFQSAANVDEATVSLHRTLEDWGEGASSSGMGGGGGTAAAAGDATWLFRYFPGSVWSTAGGSFDPAPRADTVVGGEGTYEWSSALLVADVQSFLDSPASNFGWTILGNEAAASTAKRFATREESQAELRPMLIVDYTPVPAPAGAVVLAVAGAAVARRRRAGSAA
jgi:hypothetical protein